MATSETEPERDSYIGARVTDEFRRIAKMRAAQLDKSISEYLRDLVDEDLEGTDLPKPE